MMPMTMLVMIRIMGDAAATDANAHVAACADERATGASTELTLERMMLMLLGW